MALPLKNLLQTIINPEKNWKTTLLYKWHDIIGDLHTKVHIEKIHDDMLVLGVCHSSWMQELHILSPLIIKTINEKLEYPHIKQIRFKHKQIKKKITHKAQSEMLLKKDVLLNQHDERILAKITDPTLREALRAFRIRCYRES